MQLGPHGMGESFPAGRKREGRRGAAEVAAAWEVAIASRLGAAGGLGWAGTRRSSVFCGAGAHVAAVGPHLAVAIQVELVKEQLRRAAAGGESGLGRGSLCAHTRHV